jgi:HK97 family phage prohead protease
MGVPKFRPYKASDFGGLTKSVDTDKRIVCGYFASFNTLDSDGDMFQKGAFAKSLVENKDRIMHLLQHNTLQPIGRPTTLAEDEMGLYFETPIAKTDLGDDVLQLYKEGVYKEHSVGFELINCMPITKDGDTVNLITEAKLWEGSTVSWGANSNTPVVDIKQVEGIMNQKSYIEKALKVKGLHDDLYIRLELHLKQLQTLVNASIALTPKTEAAKKEQHNEPTESQKLAEALSKITFK